MRGSKDAALAFGLRSLLNTRLQALGKFKNVTLDTTKRRAWFRVALRGEATPIDVDVRDYDLHSVDGENWLTIVDAVASREWLTAALRQFVVGRPFHLSPKTAVALRLLT